MQCVSVSLSVSLSVNASVSVNVSVNVSVSECQCVSVYQCVTARVIKVTDTDTSLGKNLRQPSRSIFGFSYVKGFSLC